MSECYVIAPLTFGLFYEPTIHPKPGAVTPLRTHADKGVDDFLFHASLSYLALLEACESRSLLSGLRRYADLVARAKIRTNIALGSFMLHLPVATVARPNIEVGELLERASEEIRRAGEEEAFIYYSLLERFRPSHLGRYEGPVPSVGAGRPKDLASALAASSWDLVHGELLSGYPTVRKVLDTLRGGPVYIKSLEALLELLAEKGDTLIASKYGYAAYKKAMEEAREALELSRRVGIIEAVEWLDRMWRPRGWNPGASLDVLSIALSLKKYEEMREG